MIVLLKDGRITILRKPFNEKKLSKIEEKSCSYILTQTLSAVDSNLISKPIIWNLDRTKIGKNITLTLTQTAGHSHPRWNSIEIYVTKS